MTWQLTWRSAAVWRPFRRRRRRQTANGRRQTANGKRQTANANAAENPIDEDDEGRALATSQSSSRWLRNAPERGPTNRGGRELASERALRSRTCSVPVSSAHNRIDLNRINSNRINQIGRREPLSPVYRPKLESISRTILCPRASLLSTRSPRKAASRAAHRFVGCKSRARKQTLGQQLIPMPTAL